MLCPPRSLTAGPADAPIIEAAAGAATGALLTVQRPSNLRDGATVVYLFQAYFPGGAPVNAEQQVAPTSGSGADGDELRFLVPAPLFTPLVFRVTAAVGAARARSPASAPSSQVLAGMPDPAAITSVFGNTYGVFPTFAKTGGVSLGTLHAPAGRARDCAQCSRLAPPHNHPSPARPPPLCAAAHADSYNVHVCDAAGALVSPPLSQPVTMDLVSGCAGGNIYCYAPVRSDLLGSPAGGAILTIKVRWQARCSWAGSPTAGRRAGTPGACGWPAAVCCS